MIEVITDKPVAVDSPDHLFPLGTRQDNSRNERFNRKLRELRGSPLRVLDLGCAGGGMVASFLEEGDFAVGIEGSDYSKARGRAEWATIPDNLFTADITEPFTLRVRRHVPLLSGVLAFDVVTAWEVMEHIREEKLPALMGNIDRHLAPNGLVIMSISSAEDIYQGVRMHQTVHSEAWWNTFFDRAGWSVRADTARWFGDDVVRGPANCPNSFVVVLMRRVTP